MKHGERATFGMRVAAAVGMAVLALAGCGGEPPTKALAEAENAMANARFAGDCAPEEYRAAQKMLDRAHALAREGKDEEAIEAARAAIELSRKAAKVAEANREECEKRAAGKERGAASADGLKPVEFRPEDETTEGLNTVFFGFDEWVPDQTARNIIKLNAAYLRRHGDLKVLLAGHCDDRGSTEYNLALGERRAAAVRDYLVQLGIDPARLSIISYGKEMPADPSGTEEARAANRRVEFHPR